MKKLLLLILVVCMVVLMSPSNVAVQATDNTFNLSDEISEKQLISAKCSANLKEGIV